MNGRVALNRYDAAEMRFDFSQNITFGITQGFGDFRVYTQDNFVVAINIFRDAARLGKDLIADRLSRFNHAGAAAIGTGRAERALKRLFDPFSGNRDKTEIVELQDFRWRAVASEFLLQGLHHFLPVLALFHIDEIEHDDAAQIAQSDLSNDLFRCFEVGLHNGVFQAIGFAHEFSGVDVNRDQ